MRGEAKRQETLNKLQDGKNARMNVCGWVRCMYCTTTVSGN